MMEIRRLLEFCLLISTLIFAKGYAQDCSNGILYSINSSNIVLLVNTTLPRICLQCVESDGTLFSNPTFLLGSNQFSETTMSDRAEVVNSVLVIDDTSLIPSGNTVTTLTCAGGIIPHNGIMIFSTVILLPNLGISSLTVLEGVSGSAFCSNLNRDLGPVTLEWLFPNGSLALDTETTTLFFGLPNLYRNDAGTYVCRLTLVDSGEVFDSPFEITVEYAPEATTPAPEGLRDFILDSSLTVSCDYVGVPAPSITWTHNNTMELDNSDSEVTITTTDTTSTLTRTNLMRDGGGDYNCFFSNSRGTFNVSVIEVRILIPPAPAVNLIVVTQMETSIGISWTNGFDGFTSITGANVSYTDGITTTSNIITMPNPVGYTLVNLDPFTMYTISVALTNAAGDSDTVEVVGNTLSLILPSPMQVVLDAVSSTELTLSWIPPTPAATTDPSDRWCIDFSLADGSEMVTRDITDPNDLNTTFSGLLKGTRYQARVAGNNIRGKGNYSEFDMEQTNVDSPSAPQDVLVTGISSFSLNITWEHPVDNGGQELSAYNLVITNSSGTDRIVDPLPGNATFYLFIDSEKSFLAENNTYDVTVTASNVEGGAGDAGMSSGSTLPITSPQPILIPPEAPSNTISNISVLVMWTFPGGDVEVFVVVYMDSLNSNEFNRTVNGSETSVTLIDLDPSTTYSVTIFTVNSLGTSALSSPQFSFNTGPAPDPVISGPNASVAEDVNVVLTCTSPNNKPIMWSRQDAAPIEPPVFIFDNTLLFTSTLMIVDIRYANRGVYVCQVGQESGEFRVEVIETTEAPTTLPEGIGSLAIIIGASVGGVALLISCSAFFILVCCCCFGRGDKSTQNVTSRSLKPDKRTNELFEVSTYVPIASDNAANSGVKDAGLSFNMPDEYQTHSSFNTLDKPSKRSTSPDFATPTSFGGPSAHQTTSSEKSGFPTAAYQDMPPPSYDDGTVL